MGFAGGPGRGWYRNGVSAPFCPVGCSLDVFSEQMTRSVWAELIFFPSPSTLFFLLLAALVGMLH